jgi:hypothetical protein
MRKHSTIAPFQLPCPRLGVALLGGALLTAGTLTLSRPAAAAPAAAAAGGADASKKKEARDAYAAGEKAYNAGDYKSAFDSFKKAHDLIPTIHAEYWMALSQSHGDDVAAATDALAAVVGSADASKLGDEKLNAAKARLEELKKTPATVTVTSTPTGASVLLDDEPQPGMTPATLTVPAGSHRLGVALRGYDVYEADLNVKPGQKLDQTVELKASAPAPAAAAATKPKAAPTTTAAATPPPAAPEEHSKVPAYITLGVGVVGAGVGTIFGIQALGAKSDFNKNPTTANADKAERDALIADMGFAVALTLGITGIVLLTTGGDSTGEVTGQATTHAHPVRARLDVAPVITGTTQGAAARLTF